MARLSRVGFRTAVRRFEDASPWLTDEHLPAVVSLRVMAATLDKGEMAPALLGQFGTAFRALQRQAPSSEAVDPLAAALAAAEAEQG